MAIRKEKNKTYTVDVLVGVRLQNGTKKRKRKKGIKTLAEAN